MTTTKKKKPVTKKKVVAKKKIVVKRNTTATVRKVEGLGKDGAIHMRVTFNGQEFEGNTDDIQTAIRSIAPVRINTKTIMQFSLAAVKDGKMIERVLMVQTARRIFGNDMATLILEKGILLALGYNGG